MIWTEILANIAWGILTWLYLNAIIPPRYVSWNKTRVHGINTSSSFTLFFFIVVLWCLELQCLVQIIINRVSLLLYDDRLKFWIKWGCFAYIALLNISVFIIWMPAQLQHKPWIAINTIWDRIEKILFLIVDLGLNLYFVYLVKTRLISSGVTKYWPLFKFNVCMIFISLSMDILIIAMMSLPNHLMYMQFHPVAYMIKLNIEMSMAHLIGKIARSHDSSNLSYGERFNSNNNNNNSGPSPMQSASSGTAPLNKFFNFTKKCPETIPLPFEERRKSIGIADFDPMASEIADGPTGRYHAWVEIGAAPKVRGEHESRRKEKRTLPKTFILSARDGGVGVGGGGGGHGRTWSSSPTVVGKEVEVAITPATPLDLEDGQGLLVHQRTHPSEALSLPELRF